MEKKKQKQNYSMMDQEDTHRTIWEILYYHFEK